MSTVETNGRIMVPRRKFVVVVVVELDRKKNCHDLCSHSLFFYFFFKQEMEARGCF